MTAAAVSALIRPLAGACAPRVRCLDGSRWRWRRQPRRPPTRTSGIRRPPTIIGRWLGAPLWRPRHPSLSALATLPRLGDAAGDPPSHADRKWRLRRSLAAPPTLHTPPTCVSTGVAALSFIDDDATLPAAEPSHRPRRRPPRGRGGGGERVPWARVSRWLRPPSPPLSVADAPSAGVSRYRHCRYRACLRWAPRHT